MTGVAVSLLLVIAAVKWWPPPAPDADEPEIPYALGPDLIEIEEITPTQQARRMAPPPPAPLPPVLVPNDVLVEEIVLDIAENYLPVEEPGDDERMAEGADAGASTQAVVEVGPKPVRFVEPEYTREARRRKVRAEVVVEVFVDEQGRVRRTEVVERYLLSENRGGRERVETLGYGLEEAAVAAAERWLFRPARRNGQPVPSYTTLTFSFGV